MFTECIRQQKQKQQQQLPCNKEIKEYESLITCVCTDTMRACFTVCWHALRRHSNLRDVWLALVCLWCGLFQVLKVLEGHTGEVYAVAVSADGSKIVSGSSDNTVRIWSAESGQVPHRSAPCLPLLCVSLLTD